MPTVEPVVLRKTATLTCPSCPHLQAAHDRIGQRFCAATTAAGLQRGCICAAGTSAASGTA